MAARNQQSRDKPSRDGQSLLRYVLPMIGVVAVTVASLDAVPAAPAQFYPAYIGLALIVAALAGRGPGFATVAASALAISYFSLTGVAFAVSDPNDAAGLIGLIAVEILGVAIIAGYRDVLAMERNRCGDLAAREAAVQASVDDVAHRLKNDLASLAAIAHIGALHAEQRETADALASFGSRIDAQARIYARLDLGRGLDSAVALKPYLESLCRDFQLAHLSLRPIGLMIEIADIEVTAKRAILLGSVVNELLTNASKHAFPADRPGTISVTFLPHRLLPDRDSLVVTDDGVGFADDRATETGMGRRLLGAMASQLGGVFHLTRVDGVTVGQVDLPR